MLLLLLFIVVIGGGLFAALFLIPKKHHRIVFIISAFIPLIFIAVRLIYRATMLDNVAYTLQALPFTLCGMTAILITIVAFTKSKLVYNLNYFLAMPGTVFAILLDNTSTTEPWSLNFWCFVVPHLFYLFVPLYMAIFNFVRPTLKFIPRTLLVFAAIIVVMHGFNSLLTWLLPTGNGFPTTNFIFTMYPGDNNGPPIYDYKQFMLLRDAWNILPVKLVYLVLLSPILVIMVFLLSLPWIKKETYKKFFAKLARKKAN